MSSFPSSHFLQFSIDTSFAPPVAAAPFVSAAATATAAATAPTPALGAEPQAARSGSVTLTAAEGREAERTTESS